MKVPLSPKRPSEYLSIVAVGAVVLFLARLILIALRLVFCLLSLLFCVLALRPHAYRFVPSNDELFDAHHPPELNPNALFVPKILHQTYKTEKIPEEWASAQSYCRELHKDYEYMFWTDSTARAFVASNYSWFLPTYDRYPHNIQRVDAFRYLLLHHFGGVYMDLDVGCRGWRLDRLRQYPMVLPTTDPVGFSNDVMISTPGHPLLEQMIHSLHHWNHIYGTKYPTVMFSTGPMFLTVQYMLYRWRYTPNRPIPPRAGDALNAAPANIPASNRKFLQAGTVGLGHALDASKIDVVNLGHSNRTLEHVHDGKAGHVPITTKIQDDQNEGALGRDIRQAGERVRHLGVNLEKGKNLKTVRSRQNREHRLSANLKDHLGHPAQEPKLVALDNMPVVTDMGEVWALPDELYGHNWKSFFVHYHGNSWHGLDTALVFWLYHNLDFVLVVIGAVGVGGLLGYVVCGKRLKRKAKARMGQKQF